VIAVHFRGVRLAGFSRQRRREVEPRIELFVGYACGSPEAVRARDTIFGDLWQSKLPDRGDSLSSATDMNVGVVATLESAACSAEVRKENR